MSRNEYWLLMIRIGAGLLAVGITIFLTADPGYVHQTEFSPDTLTFRSNNYWFYPYLSLGEEWSKPVLDRIRTFDVGGVPATSPPRWHFVHGHKTGFRGWHGDAKNAYRIFRDEGWIEWIDKNPHLADRFWPRIIRLLREERYGRAREAACFAKDAKTVEDIDQAFVEAMKE